MEILEFSPNIDDVNKIVKLIKYHGNDVCRQKIDTSWIHKCISNHSFGFICMTKKAYMGKSIKKEEDKYTVHGFIICSIEEGTNIKKAWIDLVCSTINSKVGRLLMETVEEKIKNIDNVKMILLYSLPEEKLKNWYTHLGYDVSEAHFLQSGKPKAYLMIKLL